MSSAIVSVSRWSQILPLIVAEMEKVTSIGLVLDRKRWGGNDNFREAEFLKQYTVPGKGIVNTWSIHRFAMEREFRTGREYNAIHQVQLEGWLQVDDRANTEATFQDICDDVVLQFQGPIRLGDTDNRVLIQGPAQLETIDHHRLGKVLTHHAMVTMAVQQRVLQPTFS